MNRGFYMAATGMMIEQKRLNTLSNNLANVKTPGYKQETLLTQTFDQVLTGRLDQDGIYYDYTDIGVNAPLRVVDSVEQHFTQGDITTTDRPFDVAISGDGYFNILDADGNIFYTRNGSFSLDEEGYLQLEGYGKVQGLSGDILLGTSDFTIDGYGKITIDGNIVDELQISWCDNLADLRKQSNGLYAYEGEDGMYDITTSIVQKALEASTVDLNSAMVNMIEMQRQFQAMASVLKTIDSINSLAANNIGKL